MMNAVVLLSGGLDSCVVLHHAKSLGYRLYGLSIKYGQQHSQEVQAARKIADDAYVPLRSFAIDLRDLYEGGGGDLLSSTQRQNYYVPARNSIFLSIAAGYAEAIGAGAVFYGAHRLDHGDYPDCTPKYFQAIFAALQLGTVSGIRVAAPFLFHTKAEIVTRGLELQAPLRLTRSCYLGVDPACGTCKTCQLRLRAFHGAGAVDPIDYETRDIQA